MPEEKLGIENLKKVVKFPCDLAKQVESSGKDGWQWTDSFGFLDEAMQIPGFVKSLTPALQEFKDLDAEEKVEFNAWFVGEFDIPNDKVEVFVENAFALFLALLSLVSEFKALRNGGASPVENNDAGENNP